MSKLFPEEQVVLDRLLTEWYEEIQSFTEGADDVFSEKGKMYDRTSPVWERIRFPHGFIQELRKKIDRLEQLLDPFDRDEPVRWGEVLEELGDIFNYSRMDGALIAMYLVRQEALGQVDYEDKWVYPQGVSSKPYKEAEDEPPGDEEVDAHVERLGRWYQEAQSKLQEEQRTLTDREALALANQGETPTPQEREKAAYQRGREALGRREHHD